MTGQTGSDADTLDQDVRLYVFRQAADTARVPSPAEIASALDWSPPEVEESLRRLAAGRVLILAPNTTNIWAANPFCAVPSNFRVSALERTYWGICIWDALGIAAALHTNATVTARCGDDCNQEIVLEVKDSALARGEGIVHFGVPAARWWENIGFT
jgi:alkylmercury lyase-like protein